MDNVYASRLGRAAANANPGGDSIDHGWSLLKQLHAEGFDIYPRDKKFMGRKPFDTLNNLCGLEPDRTS